MLEQKQQQTSLNTIAAAAVLSIINGCHDALEEIMFVQLARDLQRFPFCRVEKHQRAVSCRSRQDKCGAESEQTAPKQIIPGTPISPIEPLWPLTPFNYCFLSISDVTSACDKRPSKGSPNTSYFYDLIVRLRAACI